MSFSSCRLNQEGWPLNLLIQKVWQLSHLQACASESYSIEVSRSRGMRCAWGKDYKYSVVPGGTAGWRPGLARRPGLLPGAPLDLRVFGGGVGAAVRTMTGGSYSA